MINSITVGFFMPPEILTVGFFMDFPKSVGFSMVVFFMVGFLCKSLRAYPLMKRNKDILVSLINFQCVRHTHTHTPTDVNTQSTVGIMSQSASR